MTACPLKVALLSTPLRGLMVNAVLVAATLTTIVAPLVARADDAAEARYHDSIARTHFQAHRFERAIEEFLWSHRIAPNPRLLYNVALCFEELRDVENAYAYYAEYLAADDTREGAEVRRSTARDALVRLQPSVARLRVDTNPPGAAVYVDTEDHGAYGATPRSLVLPPGPHALTLRAEGYRTATVEVTLVRGAEVSVRTTLERIEGVLVIDLEGGPLPVVVRSVAGDIEVTGSAPGQFDLPPGVYTIEGELDTHLVSARVVQVQANERTHVDLVLVPRPQPTTGLTVTTSTEAALVSVDGVEVGFTPLLLSEAPVGLHSLRLDAPGRDPWEGELTLTDEQHTWVTVSLREAGRRRLSPVGYAIGTLGLSALVGLAVSASLAARARSDFRQLRSVDAAGAASARSRGVALNRACDALLGIGLGGLSVGLTLLFVLDDPRNAPSSATISQRPR